MLPVQRGGGLQSLLPTEPRLDPQRDARQQQQQPQQHRFQPQLKPVDEQTIVNLQQFLQAGGDPDYAMSVMNEIMGRTQGLADARRVNYQEKQASLESLLPQIEQDVASQAAAGIPSETIEAGYSEYGPRVQNSLDDMLAPLYQGQPISPLAQEPAAAAEPLDGDSIMAVAEDARNFAGGYLQDGVPIPPLSLHDARMRIITPLRAQGYSEAEIDNVYDLIGNVYSQVPGAQINAPLTSAEQMASMASAGTAPTQAPMPVMPSPTSAPQPWDPNANPMGGLGVEPQPGTGGVPMPGYVAPSLRDLAIFQR